MIDTPLDRNVVKRRLGVGRSLREALYER